MIRRVEFPLNLALFDEVIDVRAPEEFAIDHVPGAVSLPVLDDNQRARIGTLFKQDSSFLARRTGAAMICRNIAGMMETHFANRPAVYRPLVYCWRGGQRSASLATILDAVGWRVSVLQGGYKHFRHHVLAELDTLPPRLNWRVIQGPTGSGKTRLLHALTAGGAQVLDLEAIARHRASVLGREPGQDQPAQRGFETALWQALSGLDPAQPVFVEAENRRIGRLHLPATLWQAITAAPVTALEVDRRRRVDHLLRDYPHMVAEPDMLARQLQLLIPFQGREVVGQWHQWIEQGRWHDLVDALLERHYDPLYARNSPYQPAGRNLPLAAVEPAALAAAAATLIGGEGSAGGKPAFPGALPPE